MKRHERARLRVGCVLATAVLGLAVVGCGSSSSGTSSTASSSSASSASSSGTPTASQIASYKATIAQQQVRPTSIGVTAPINGTIPKGKTIADVALGEPLGVAQGQFATEAGKALGWNVKVINAGVTPQTVQAAWQQALADHPDGIIGTGGFPRSYYAAQLAQAKAQHIPVVEISDPGTATGGVTVTLDSQARYLSQGIALAEWIMAKVGAHAHALIQNVPAFTAVNTEATSAANYLKSHCSGCTATLVNVAATSTKMAGNIASALQANSKVNVVVPITGDFSIGTPAALAGVGRAKLPVVETTQDSSSMQYVKAGQISSIYAYSTPEWTWRAFDAFARVFTHQSPAPDTLNWTKWWITSQNAPADLIKDPFGPIVQNYQAQFEKLWHVS